VCCAPQPSTARAAAIRARAAQPAQERPQPFHVVSIVPHLTSKGYFGEYFIYIFFKKKKKKSMFTFFLKITTCQNTSKSKYFTEENLPDE